MQNIPFNNDERLDTVNDQIKLLQKKDGLTFGTDAFLLASFIKPKSGGRAVELGAGTGIISLLLASRNKFKHITAIEIQQDFAGLAARNTELNSLEEKIRILCADIRDITPQNLAFEADVVFSNPPYMKINSGKRNISDYKYIARHEVCGNINDFCASAYRLLKHGGKFYVVWRPDRLCDIICSLRNNKLEPKIMTLVCADAADEPSMALICATKGGACGLDLTPPLIIYSDKSKSVMSEKSKRIYETLSFD